MVRKKYFVLAVLQDNNLELSDKPLDEDAAASLAAMFRDDD